MRKNLKFIIILLSLFLSSLSYGQNNIYGFAGFSGKGPFLKAKDLYTRKSEKDARIGGGFSPTIGFSYHKPTSKFYPFVRSGFNFFRKVESDSLKDGWHQKYVSTFNSLYFNVGIAAYELIKIRNLGITPVFEVGIDQYWGKNYFNSTQFQKKETFSKFGYSIGVVFTHSFSRQFIFSYQKSGDFKFFQIHFILPFLIFR